MASIDGQRIVDDVVEEGMQKAPSLIWGLFEGLLMSFILPIAVIATPFLFTRWGEDFLRAALKDKPEWLDMIYSFRDDMVAGASTNPLMSWLAPVFKFFLGENEVDAIIDNKVNATIDASFQGNPDLANALKPIGRQLALSGFDGDSFKIAEGNLDASAKALAGKFYKLLSSKEVSNDQLLAVFNALEKSGNGAGVNMELVQSALDKLKGDSEKWNALQQTRKPVLDKLELAKFGLDLKALPPQDILKALAGETPEAAEARAMFAKLAETFPDKVKEALNGQDVAKDLIAALDKPSVRAAVRDLSEKEGLFDGLTATLSAQGKSDSLKAFAALLNRYSEADRAQIIHDLGVIANDAGIEATNALKEHFVQENGRYALSSLASLVVKAANTVSDAPAPAATPEPTAEPQKQGALPVADPGLTAAVADAAAKAGQATRDAVGALGEQVPMGIKGLIPGMGQKASPQVGGP